MTTTSTCAQEIAQSKIQKLLANPIVVSACLLGIPCRYDGTDKKDDNVIKLVSHTPQALLGICPELMAGLGVPRPPLEWKFDKATGNFKLVNQLEVDVTNRVATACQQIVKLAQRLAVRLAILKENSPCCGCTYSFVEGELSQRPGLCANLLQQRGVLCISEHVAAYFEALDRAR